MTPQFLSLLKRSLIAVCLCLLALGLVLPVGGRQPKASYAQSSNTLVWDFETGTINDWQTSGQVQVITDTIDLLTDNSMHSVAQGTYSLRIGDSTPWAYSGDQFSSIEQTIRIPQIDKPVLQFSYAVVANDPPSHPDTDKPYFQLNVQDLTTGDVLPVSDFKYTSQTNHEWYLGQPPAGTSLSQSSFYQLGGDRWVFIPWKHEKVDLSGRGGHQLLINFTVRDCNPQAHAAYSYVDNIRVGQVVVLPKLPDLVKQPLPAGPPPGAGLIAGLLNFTEKTHIWPWCLLPLLLIPLLLLWYFLQRGKVIGYDSTKDKTEGKGRRPPSSPGAGNSGNANTID